MTRDLHASTSDGFRTADDVRGTRFLDVALGGLSYQIEHHLFRSMPRPHLRRAAPIIEAYRRERGVTYTQTGLFTSYGIVLRDINRVGVGGSDPFGCPSAAQRSAL